MSLDRCEGGADPSGDVLPALALTVTFVAAAQGPAEGPRYPVVRVRQGHHVVLRHRPDGSRVTVLGDRTEYGRPTVLSVTRVRGHWAAVSTDRVANGRRAWLRLDPAALRGARIGWQVRADLSERRLTVRHDGRLVRRFSVAVGAPGTETPTGRFAITDRLDGRRFGRSYGRWILALSGRQPKVRLGGTYGRLAIHGTDRPWTVGTASSLGCLRARPRALRWLAGHLPAGTPVVIRS